MKDLPKDKVFTEIFDAVFICNGNSNASLLPKIDGMNRFVGKQLHSHDYRNSDLFKGNEYPNLGLIFKI